MTVEDAYTLYLSKTDKNITNDNLSTEKGRFCIRFNEESLQFLRELLQVKGTDEIRYANKFLVLNAPIPVSTTSEKTNNFALPENFFDLGNIRAFASKGKCKNQEIYLYETLSENYTEQIRNQNTTPDFGWRESLFTLSDKEIKVFYNDFTVDRVLLSYYRYPQRIKLVDENDPESQFDETAKIEWDDIATQMIIDRCVLAFDITNNSTRTQQSILNINN